MEEFYSIQGEGYNTGQAAYFIRIGGCDVGCHWCDVKESWNAKVHPLTEVDGIVARATSYPGKAVVLTGGEPGMYSLDHLCKGLSDNDICIFLEMVEKEGYFAKIIDWYRFDCNTHVYYRI